MYTIQSLGWMLDSKAIRPTLVNGLIQGWSASIAAVGLSAASFFIQIDTKLQNSGEKWDA